MKTGARQNAFSILGIRLGANGLESEVVGQFQTRMCHCARQTQSGYVQIGPLPNFGYEINDILFPLRLSGRGSQGKIVYPTSFVR